MKRSRARQVLAIAVLALAFSVESCKKGEKEPAPPVVVQFATATQTIVEGAQVNITVTLSAPTQEAVSIPITLGGSAQYTSDFNTTPSGSSGKFTVDLPVGASSGVFTLASVNNDVYEGDKTVTFTIGIPPSGYNVGSINAMTLTIQEDESIATVGFAVTTATVGENETSGITVQLPFSATTKGAGTITVTFASNNAPAGSISSIPTASGNTITLPVTANSTSTSFTVVPKDDDFFHADYVYVFEITGATGAIKAGTPTRLTLTIHEDESPSLVNLGEAAVTISETSAPIFVQLPLNIPASGDGTIQINASSPTATYGTHYSTSPPAIASNISIAVAKGATYAQFQITPVDDLIDNPDRVITFTITGTTGVVRLGTLLTYVLTITDNEPTLRKAFISFGGASAPLVTGTVPEQWNHAYTDTPNAGVTFANLVRSDGVITNMALVIVTPLSPQPLGKVTGLNSGAFPDNALRDYWYVPGPVQGQTRSFAITQLDNTKTYSFRMIGSTTATGADGKNSMTIAVAGEQKQILDVTNNVSQVLTWTGKSPSASIIQIDVIDTLGGGICPLNALEISWYED